MGIPVEDWTVTRRLSRSLLKQGRRMRIFALFLLVFLILTGTVPEEFRSEQDSTDSGLFQILVRMAGGYEIRPWAKPIESVDMEWMMELFESGNITFHTADWYTEKDDTGE